MSRMPIEERRHIVELSLREYSQRTIADLTGRSIATVNRIIQAYRDKRRLEDASHRRRPRVTTEKKDLQLVAAVAAIPFQSAREVLDTLGIDASARTERRRFAEAGLSSRRAAQKPLLSESNIRDRLQFAGSTKSGRGTTRGKVMFSDESTFTTQWNQRLRVWRPVNCRYDPQFVQEVAASGRTAVNVWDTVSREGLGPLLRIEGSLTSDSYCTIIDHVMLPYALDGSFSDGNYVLQHDLSPVHTSRKVRSLLEERCVTKLPWPPKGADMNIIEHVWGRIKVAMSRRPLHRASADELWEAVRLSTESAVLVHSHHSRVKTPQEHRLAQQSLPRSFNLAKLGKLGCHRPSPEWPPAYKSRTS
ncbi:putative transposable element tc1 transposase [Ixodes scapularis]